MLSRSRTTGKGNCRSRTAQSLHGWPGVTFHLRKMTKSLAVPNPFVAGSPINLQLSVKDSKKYASTGGWGYAQFKDGKPASEAVHETCAPCHVPAKAHDFVYTYYSPSP